MTTGTGPIMRRALGDGWNRLGDVVRTHYNVTPGREGAVVMNGTMTVYHSRLAYPFLVMGRIMGALIAKKGENVPVCVRNWCRPGSPAIHWHRTFYFPGGAPLVFSSRMEHLAGDEIVEYVGLGLGVRLRLTEENGAMVFTSRGYQWKLGPLSLALPDWLFLGKSSIREIPVDDRHFRVEFTMRHPLLGETFGYHGNFSLEPVERPAGKSATAPVTEVG
jgi:hypothetical protein